MIDDVRRRVQQEQTGHRGRKCDPLYRIRKLLREMCRFARTITRWQPEAVAAGEERERPCAPEASVR